MPQKLLNKATGERDLIDDADLPAALASGDYVAPDAIAVHRTSGDQYAATDVARGEMAQGTAHTIDAATLEAQRGRKIREDRNSGVVGGAKALIGGAAEGLSGGAFSPFDEAQEFHPLLAGTGTFIGAVAPAFVGDDAGLVSLLARDGAEAEKAGAALSSKFLYSGEAGAEAGSVAKSAERGLARAGSELAEAKAIAHAAPDLATLDAAGLDAAHESEIGSLVAKQTADRASTVDDLVSYRAQLKEANPYLVAEERDIGRIAGANSQFERALDAPKALRRNPSSLLRNLERQEQALEATLAKREALAAQFEATDAKIVGELRGKIASVADPAAEIELSGKAMRRYAAYADVKIARKAESIAVPRSAVEKFAADIESGAVKGASETALSKLDGVLQANRDLQAKIASSMAPKAELSSERLAAIRNAKEALKAGRTPSTLETMLSGSIMGHVTGMVSGLPVIGPIIGAKAGQLATDLVFGRLGKATAAMSERGAKAVEAFLNVGKRAARTPTALVLASKTLARVAYGPSKATDDKSLHGLYKARTDEIKAQTMYGPDGSIQVRPAARMAMGEKLAPIRAVAPIVADKLETLAARRLAFLSSKIPRRPDVMGVQVGPDHWQPSDLEMRTFARYAAAVEDPAGIVERLAHGTITPEDGETMRAVYPEMFAQIKQSIISQLPTLRKTLPYERRVALSIFSGVPVDPAMHPQILSVLQSQFAEEPGTEQGTQAPQAAPQFGSISKSTPAPTPAQERAG